MASGRIPGPLSAIHSGGPASPPGSIVMTAGPLGSGHHADLSQSVGINTPGPAKRARLVGLTVTHGARRNPQNPSSWDSYLFLNESIIVMAKTDPDNWTTWQEIEWQSTGGKPIVGSRNGFSIPRSEMKTYRVSASLGGVSATLTITVTTLVDLTGRGGTGGSLGTPIHPIGTGCKINLYGEHETDALGFKDYVVIKEYQNPGDPDHPPAQLKDKRPLTKAPLSASPPDGPGLPNDCASDICMRACPFYSPSYYAIQRIRNKRHCRITYYTPNNSHLQSFLDAFPDASHIQHWRVDNVGVEVIEYPREFVWSGASDVTAPVIPSPDHGFYVHPHKTRVTEEDGLT